MAQDRHGRYSLRAGEQRAHSIGRAIVWHSADIPAQGHYCFIEVAGNAQEPKPDPTTFTSFDQYVAFVENNNNVAWRNFNVVPGPSSPTPPPGAYKLDFLIPGAFDTGHVFGLEAMGGLPEKSRVFLEVPAWLAGRFSGFGNKSGNIAL